MAWRGGAAVVAGHLDPATGGQLGAGAAPEQVHSRTAAPVPSASPNSAAPPPAAGDQLAVRQRLALRGGREIVEVAPEHPFTSVDGPWTGTELAGAPVDAKQTQEHAPPVDVRTWRSFWRPRKNRGTAPYLGRPGYTDALDAHPDTEATPAETNVYHVVDVRRPTAGYPLTDPALEPQIEVVDVAAAAPVDFAAHAAPPRSPLGTPRPATMPHAFFYRVYGHQQADHLTGAKGVLGQPTVGLPVNTGAEAPGKEPAPGMRPALTTKPNTWRTIPTPWDADIIDDGTTTPTVSPRRRFR